MEHLSQSVKSFIVDESFQSWVVRPTEETDEYWQKYQEQYPEKKKSNDSGAAMDTGTAKPFCR